MSQSLVRSRADFHTPGASEGTPGVHSLSRRQSGHPDPCGVRRFPRSQTPPPSSACLLGHRIRSYGDAVRRAVVDTNVLVSGLSRTGPAGAVIDAWVERRFRPCVSTALALEYEELLVRKLGEHRRETELMALQALLARSEYVPVRFTYRPASPDPKDDLVVDCVLNSQALLVTDNERDFRGPSRELGFTVLRPARFLKLLEDDS